MNSIKSKIISATIPGVVGMFMIGATWGIIHSVRQEILSIAANAAKAAVVEALAIAKPAIAWRGVNVVTPTVKINDELVLDYIARVNKECFADLRAFLLDTHGSAVYRFPDRLGGYTKADPEHDQVIRVKFPIVDPPSGDQFKPLEPGVYTYRVRATRYCETIQLDNSIPDATFTLVR